jgi:4-hydroxy-4-methyl-2-oxoglutarate aldolase
MADDDGVVVVKKEDFQSTLEASTRRLAKVEQTKEKIARGDISIDFYGLRETLKQENVMYYDDARQLGDKKI